MKWIASFVFCITLLLTALLTASAWAQESIKIGLITPLSGAGSAYGPEIVKAAQKAAAQINQAGGILSGRKLEILVEDSATDTLTAMRVARKLTEISQVVAIIGLWGSGPTMAVKAVAQEHNITVMTQAIADIITLDNKNQVWRFQTAASDWGAPVAKAMLADGRQKVSVLSLNNPFTSHTVDSFIDTMTKGGGELLKHFELTADADQDTYNAEIDQIIEQQPDALFVPVYSEQLGPIVKRTQEKKYSGAIYTFSMAVKTKGDNASLTTADATAASGLHHLQPTVLKDRGEYQQFLQQLEYDSEEQRIYAAFTIDQINILALSMEKAGSSEASVFSREIAAISDAPGEKTADIVKALELIRNGEAVDYTGTAMDIAFKADGSLLNQPFAHLRREGKKNVPLAVIQ